VLHTFCHLYKWFQDSLKYLKFTNKIRCFCYLNTDISVVDQVHNQANWMQLKQNAAAKWRMSSSELRVKRNDAMMEWCNVSWLWKHWGGGDLRGVLSETYRCNPDWLIRGTSGCQHYSTIQFPLPMTANAAIQPSSSSLAAHVKRYFSCHFMLQLFQIKSMRKDFSPAPTPWLVGNDLC